jgi:hypothetical protein
MSMQYCVIGMQSTYLSIFTYAFQRPKLSKQLKGFLTHEHPMPLFASELGAL